MIQTFRTSALLLSVMVGCLGCSKEPPPADPPKPVPTPDPNVAKMDEAHLGCVRLDAACLSYTISASNPGVVDEEKLPQDVNSLLEPPWGGGSFLKNGKADTLDPWGKPYELKLTQRKDGTTYIVVMTTAPDGTKISQFGVGKVEESKGEQ